MQDTFWQCVIKFALLSKGGFIKMIKRHLSNRASSIVSLSLAVALFPALIFLSVRLPHFVTVLLNVHEAIGNDGVLQTWERTAVLVDAYAMLAVAFAAIALLIILLRSTLSEKVFSEIALRTLNGLSACCFLEGILLIYIAVYFPAVLCLTLAAFFLGVCLRVVRNVIAEAMRYKEENDLTV